MFLTQTDIGVHVRNKAHLDDEPYFRLPLVKSDRSTLSSTSFTPDYDDSNTLTTPTTSSLLHEITSGIQLWIPTRFRQLQPHDDLLKLMLIIYPNIHQLPLQPITMSPSNPVINAAADSGATPVLNSDLITIITKRELINGRLNALPVNPQDATSKAAASDEPLQILFRHKRTVAHPPLLVNPRCVHWAGNEMFRSESLESNATTATQPACRVRFSNETHTSCECSSLGSYVLIMDHLSEPLQKAQYTFSEQLRSLQSRHCILFASTLTSALLLLAAGCLHWSGRHSKLDSSYLDENWVIGGSKIPPYVCSLFRCSVRRIACAIFVLQVAISISLLFTVQSIGRTWLDSSWLNRINLPPIRCDRFCYTSAVVTQFALLSAFGWALLDCFALYVLSVNRRFWTTMDATVGSDGLINGTTAASNINNPVNTTITSNVSGNKPNGQLLLLQSGPRDTAVRYGDLATPGCDSLWMKINQDGTAAWCRRALLLAGHLLPLILCAVGVYGDRYGYKQQLTVPMLLRSAATHSIEYLQFCWRKMDSWLLMLTYVPLFALLLAALVFLIVAVALQRRSEQTLLRNSPTRKPSHVVGSSTKCGPSDQSFWRIGRQVVWTQTTLWLTTIGMLILFQVTSDQFQITFNQFDEMPITTWANWQLQALVIVTSLVNFLLCFTLAARLTSGQSWIRTGQNCFTCWLRPGSNGSASCAVVGTDYGSSLYGFPGARPVVPMQPMDAFKLEQKLLRSAYSDAYENANTLRCGSAAQPLIPPPQMMMMGSGSGDIGRTTETQAIYSVRSESDTEEENDAADVESGSAVSPETEAGGPTASQQSQKSAKLNERPNNSRTSLQSNVIGVPTDNAHRSIAIESTTSPSAETSPEDSSGGGISSSIGGGLGSAGSGGSLIRSGCSSIGSAFVNTANRLYSPAPSYNRYQALRLNQVYGMPNEHLYECIEENARHASNVYESPEYAYNVMHRLNSSHPKSDASFYANNNERYSDHLHSLTHQHHHLLQPNQSNSSRESPSAGSNARTAFNFNTLGHSNMRPQPISSLNDARSDSHDRIVGTHLIKSSPNWSATVVNRSTNGFMNSSINRINRLSPEHQSDQSDSAGHLRHKRKRHRSGSQASQMSAFDFTSFQR